MGSNEAPVVNVIDDARETLTSYDLADGRVVVLNDDSRGCRTDHQNHMTKAWVKPYWGR